MIQETDLRQPAHPSEEALDDLLMDSGRPADLLHVASCEECTARLETFRSSMALFSQASFAWSEAKSNSVSRELRPRRASFSVLPAWSIAVAFFFALALTFLVGLHRGTAPHSGETVDSARTASGEQMNREQEIAGDNAMLHAIDTAIAMPVESPVEVDGVQKSDATIVRRGTPHEVRD